ncbi:MAG: DNA polymerase Y family protein [Deltaproteobacteria bacterium]|nr:DNA polymerase Y family protein [Deltaproteobacteria bacterium]
MIGKRIAAIVADRLAVELAERARRERAQPLAVLVDDDEARAGDDGDAALDAVNELAWQRGARPGQTVTAASAYVGRLEVMRLTTRALDAALASIAEIALAFAPLVSLELDRSSPEPFVRYPAGAGAGPRDTVWLDVTGCARMLGGEDILCAELRARLGELGHHARVAVADGPRLAQALARWGGLESVASRGASGGPLAELPIACLPLDASIVAWLGEVGLWNVGELASVPRSRLAHRLGPRAQDVLELIAGRDEIPLRPYEPPRRVVEHIGFDEPLERQEPLLFVVRGMVARAVARLAARGEACGKVTLELHHDRAALALAEREGRRIPPLVSVDPGLPIALAREDDLVRALRTRLEKLELVAPIGAVSLVLDDLTRRSEAQLDLSNLAAVSPDAFPTLLAELCAAVGPERVGVLEVKDSHRPEARSVLVPAPYDRNGEPRGLGPRKRRSTSRVASAPSELPPPQQGVEEGASSSLHLTREPTRLLPEPLCIGQLRPGGLVAAGPLVYLVDHLRLSSRLDGVEWWSANPISRDYARVRLHATFQGRRAEHAEAWIYMERSTGRAFLHGWFE